MKKLTLLILTTLFSGCFVVGQNVHVEYSASNFDFLSSTTVVSSNTYTTYMIATNDNNQLIVSELNTYPYLEPVTTNSVAFQMNDNIFIKGGFFDTDENIVVYGYTQANKNGIIIKITMNNGSATSVFYNKNNNSSTEVIDGCWSETVFMGNTYKTYDFIFGNSIFVRMNSNFSTSALLPAIVNKKFNNGNMLSVSWDDINKNHIISGNNSNKCYIGYCSNTNNFSPSIFYELTLPTGFIFSESTNRHVLSDEDSIVFLIQDIRFINNTGDGLWISKINYISGELHYSFVYRFGLEKVWILDATKNFEHLFVLGHHNGKDTIISGGNPTIQTFERRFLAQFNMYDTTDYIVNFMSDYNLTNMQTPSPQYSSYDMINTLYLNNVRYNPAMETVYSSGAIQGKSYIIETYNLNYEEDCDSSKNVIQQNVTNIVNIQQCPISVSTSVSSQFAWADITGIVTNPNLLSFSESIICPNYYMANYYQENRISELNRNFKKSQEIENTANSSNLIARIEITDNQNFICKNFDGSCYFKIYDITGRILSEGITQNEKTNKISINEPGIYVISVRDSKNKTASTRIKILY